MYQYIKTQKRNFVFMNLARMLVLVLSFALIFSPTAAQAQSVLNLPQPGAMIPLSPAFAPVLLKGMTLHPEDPLRFDFIVDGGNTGFSGEEIKQESERLVKYFLAAMTIPKDDLWVNLSPYEDNRIIPEELGKTELGRDMLAQDYILKQFTASLVHPDQDLGEKFWQRIRERAQAEFGVSDIKVDSFNKVWILPETASVYEHNQTVYVVESRLKVMLESDYIALSLNKGGDAVAMTPTPEQELNEQIIKDIVLPEIEKEVNTNKNFAPLRQIYHSLILAKWYKQTIKESLLSAVYFDQNLTAGIDVKDPAIKDKIYQQYIKAYKRGVFNLIKNDYDRLSQQNIPRKYFSGGIPLTDVEVTQAPDPRKIEQNKNPQFRIDASIKPYKNQGGFINLGPLYDVLKTNFTRLGKVLGIISMCTLGACGGGGSSPSTDSTPGTTTPPITGPGNPATPQPPVTEPGTPGTEPGTGTEQPPVTEPGTGTEQPPVTGPVQLPDLGPDPTDGFPIVLEAATEYDDKKWTSEQLLAALTSPRRPIRTAAAREILAQQRTAGLIGATVEPALTDAINSFINDRFALLNNNPSETLASSAYLDLLMLGDAAAERFLQIIKDRGANAVVRAWSLRLYAETVGDFQSGLQKFREEIMTPGGIYSNIYFQNEIVGMRDWFERDELIHILISRQPQSVIIDTLFSAELIEFEGAIINRRASWILSQMGDTSITPALETKYNELLTTKIGIEDGTVEVQYPGTVLANNADFRYVIISLLTELAADSSRDTLTRAVDTDGNSSVVNRARLGLERLDTIATLASLTDQELMDQSRALPNQSGESFQTGFFREPWAIQKAALLELYHNRDQKQFVNDITTTLALSLTSENPNTPYTDLTAFYLQQLAQIDSSPLDQVLTRYANTQPAIWSAVLLGITKGDVNAAINQFIGQIEEDVLNERRLRYLQPEIFAGIRALFQQQETSYLDHFTQNTSTPVPLRLVAVKILGERGRRNDMAALAGLITNYRIANDSGQAWFLRLAIVEAASHTLSDAALDFLNQVRVNDPEPQVQVAASKGIAAIDPTTDLATLLEGLGLLSIFGFVGTLRTPLGSDGDSTSGSNAKAADPAQGDKKGGIDLNTIDVDRKGSGVDIQFDAVNIQEILDMNIDGFTPVIINVTPLPSVLPLLGLDQTQDEPFEVSSHRGLDPASKNNL